MSKPTLTVDSKRIVLDVCQITLTIEQLTVAMNNVYEASFSRVNKFRWSDLYSVAFSVSATLFVSCLTCNFKDFSDVISWLNAGRLSFGAWLSLTVLFVFGVICLCNKSHKNDGVFVDRNNTVVCEINKLQSKNEEAA